MNWIYLKLDCVYIDLDSQSSNFTESACSNVTSCARQLYHQRSQKHNDSLGNEKTNSFLPNESERKIEADCGWSELDISSWTSETRHEISVYFRLLVLVNRAINAILVFNRKFLRFENYFQMFHLKLKLKLIYLRQQHVTKI